MDAQGNGPDPADARLQGTVLLVDDEDEVVSSLSRFLALRFPSVRVVTANDGPLALKIIEVVDPDVVLSDYVMPGMSGLALLASVHTRRPAAFRVLLSAYATSETYTQALRAGTVDILLQKPSDSAEISRTIRRGLATSAQRRARPPPALHAHGEVLIVGEGHDLEEVLAEHFRETTADVHVRSAPSANAALQALGQRPADVILADAHLPDMAGAEFLKKAHLVQPRARTVLVASRAERPPRGVPRSDVDHLFVKPVDMARFARAIERLLPHDAAREPGSSPPGE